MNQKISTPIKPWLKGGLIGVGIGIIFWVVFHFITRGLIDKTNIGFISLFNYIYLPIYVCGGFILFSIIGFIIGKIVRKPGSSLSKSWKIGFWIGLILGALLWAYWAYDNFWGATHVPGLIIIPIGIVIVGVILGTIIGWIVGKRN